MDNATCNATAAAAARLNEQKQVPIALVGEHTLTLLLVRHGETAFNAEGRFQGHQDIPLSPRGIEQARRLASRLQLAWHPSEAATSLLPGPPRRFYSSDLSRAMQTARTIANAITENRTVHETPLLRERGFGSWEGLTAAEIQQRFGAKTAAALHPVDGEIWEDVARRMETALSQFWKESFSAGAQDDVVLVAGHGGSLRLLLSRTLGVGAEASRGFRLDNTGLSAIRFTGSTSDIAQSEGRVLLVNDTAHLQNDSLYR